jgi:hypothetical protein
MERYRVVVHVVSPVSLRDISWNGDCRALKLTRQPHKLRLVEAAL